MSDLRETLQSLLQLAGGEDFRDAKYLYDDALAYVTELAAENERLKELTPLGTSVLDFLARLEAAEKVAQLAMGGYNTSDSDMRYALAVWQAVKEDTHE